jgi:hypothetical protein
MGARRGIPAESRSHHRRSRLHILRDAKDGEMNGDLLE